MDKRIMEIRGGDSDGTTGKKSGTFEVVSMQKLSFGRLSKIPQP
jgi:hypothetical protein